MTRPMRSSSRRNVSAYSSSGPPTGSGIDPEAPSPCPTAKDVSIAARSPAPSSATRMRCIGPIVRMRSAVPASSRVRSVAECPERSSPWACAARSAPPEAGLPSKAATPAERTSKWLQPSSTARRRAMTSAMGLRHVLPVHTKRRR